MTPLGRHNYRIGLLFFAVDRGWMLGQRPESTSAREVGFDGGIGGKILPLHL